MDKVNVSDMLYWIMLMNTGTVLPVMKDLLLITLSANLKKIKDNVLKLITVLKVNIKLEIPKLPLKNVILVKLEIRIIS